MKSGEQSSELDRLMADLAQRARLRAQGGAATEAEYQAGLDQLLAAAYQLRDREQAQHARIAELEEEAQKLRRELEGLRKSVAHLERPRKPALFHSFARMDSRAKAEVAERARAKHVERKRRTESVLRRAAPPSPSVVAAAGADAGGRDEAVRVTLTPAVKRTLRRRKSRLWVVLPKVAVVVMALGAVVGAVGGGLDRGFVHDVGLAVALGSGVLALVMWLPMLIARLMVATHVWRPAVPKVDPNG